MKTFNTCLISQGACTRCSRSRVPKAISTFTYDFTTINEFLQVRIRISQLYENFKNLSFLLQNRKQRKAYAINQNHGVILETYEKIKRCLRQISMEGSGESSKYYITFPGVTKNRDTEMGVK